MSVAKIIKFSPGRCPVSLQVSKGVYAPCSKTDNHDGLHKSSDGIEFETHPAGCACGPCHNERIGERTQPRQDTPEGACGIRDGASGRVCLRESGHAGVHMTGYRYFADPLPEAPKKTRQKKPAAAKAQAKPDAKATEVAEDKRPAAQRCFCGGKDGKSRPHSLGEPVVCRIPNHEMCVCVHGKERTHMFGAPGCTARPVPVCEDGTDELGDVAMPRPCGAKLARVGTCKLFDGHTGEHFTEVSGVAHTWSSDGDGDSWDVCGARWSMHPSDKGPKKLPKDGQTICQRPGEHDGAHRGLDDIGNHMSEWDGDGSRGGCHSPKTAIDLVAELLGRGRRDHTDEGSAIPVPDVHATEREIEGAIAERKAEPPLSGPLTKIGKYEVHPAAALFPMIDEAEYPGFIQDIRTNGQRQKIVRIKVGSSGLILDGRNRLRACLEIGIEPAFRDFGSEPSDGTDPIAFVISENVRRRHLNETQRAFVGAELVPMYEQQAKERQRGALKQNATTVSPNSGSRDKGKATELAARAVNVGKTSVEAALKVKREAAPEVLAASKEAGKLSVSAAADLAKLPKQKQREIIEKVDSKTIRAGKVRALVRQEEKRDVVRRINSGLVAPMPVGQFGVIYGDYPWEYDNSDQHEGSRGHMGYPPMPMEQILEHAREAAKRAAEKCILALWVTNLYVPKIGLVEAAYGAEHHTMLTWPKERAGVGSWPRGQTEHLVIATIGDVPVHTLNEISTLLPPWKPERPGEHSSKPAEVAALLAKHCGGPFLELFARDQREGWTCWGAEVNKFAATEAA